MILENNSLIETSATDSELEGKLVDMLDIPGKGRCYVYLARYSYDPFLQSLNDNPEHELPLSSGDYVLIWGHADEDGYFLGELLDGRKGLVPSNFIEKLCGEDLLEFHRCAVLSDEMQDESSYTVAPVNLPIEYAYDGGSDETPEHEHMVFPEKDSYLLNATFLTPDDEDLENTNVDFGNFPHRTSQRHIKSTLEKTASSPVLDTPSGSSG